MSAFDEWYRNRDAAFASPSETNVEYDERLGREAWNVALDQLEGLAEGWAKDKRFRTWWNDSGVKFKADGPSPKECTKELLARIKELKETT